MRRSSNNSTIGPQSWMRYCAALALTIALIMPGHAQEAASPAAIENRQNELSDITRALEQTRKERDILESEIEALATDAKDTNRRLIDIAGRIQEKEEDVSAIEDRLEALGEEESELRSRLAERRLVLADLIGALQRLGRNPPPAIMVHPDDALSSVRSAIALGAVLPELRGAAQALIDDLEELAAVRDQTTESRSALEAETEILSAEQRELALLVESKRRRIADEREALGVLNRNAEDLAANASSLQDLISGMEQEIDQYRTALASRAEAESRSAEEGGGLTPDQLQSYFAAQEQAIADEERALIENPLIAQSDPARLEPAIPFTRAKGLLPLPARGVVLSRYGDDDGFGSEADGLSVATRRNAQVVSPADGWVVYAGPFRSFGQILIIDAGEDHHIVLAGMGRINVTQGQFILAGEPVAVMGGRPVRVATTAMTAGNAQPVLYVEFRKGGQAIDSSAWWSSETMRVGG